MYRVIIVDDEDEVRDGIKQKIDWPACGFELVGDFDNGRDLLESVEQLKPDVVITDICMPFMDGLEMTRQLTLLDRDLKIVIITGFEDFEYAKQAIKLKVKDYLLKPINAEEFTAFLHKMRQELADERKRKEDLSELTLRLNQSMPLLRERFLERMVTSRLPLEEIRRKCHYFGLSVPGPSFVVLIADIDEFHLESAENKTLDMELLRFGAYNILQEIFEKDQGGLVFQTRDDKTAIIYSGLSEVEGTAQSLARYAGNNIQRYLKLTISIGIGRTYTDLQQLPQSFQEALSALDYRFLMGKDQVIAIQDLEYGRSVDQISYNVWEQKIVVAIKSGNRDNVSEMLRGVIEEWKTTLSSIDKCYGFIHKLLVSLINLVVETGFDESRIFPDNPFQQIQTMKTLEDVMRWLEGLCHQTIHYLSQQRTVVTHSQMTVAEAYIKEHYADVDLTLHHVCSHIYMSSSYFSLQFKKHTGATFLEYLTRFRMEKAKELLALTQLKTYDIAARVGYNDQQYFSVIFKRNTGMTPKEYRNSQRGTG